MKINSFYAIHLDRTALNFWRRVYATHLKEYKGNGRVINMPLEHGEYYFQETSLFPATQGLHDRECIKKLIDTKLGVNASRKRHVIQQ